MRSVSSHLGRLRREESGQALALTAIAAVAILSFVGLAVDVGHLHYEQRQLQTAADAAALSGALELSACGGSSGCSTMQTAAQQALVENGLTGSTLLTQCATRPANALSLTVNNGPCYLGSTASDPNYGNAKYVETVVTAPVPTYFMRIIGINSVNETVRGEATVGNSPNCLFTNSLVMNSGSHLTASCGTAVGDLTVNSGSHMSATQITYYGSYTHNGGNPSPKPSFTSIHYSDPLSWVPTPQVGNCTNQNPVGGDVTMNPGTYCGININSGGRLTLNPGTYIFTGSVNVGSGSSITGSDVTLYFSSGSFTGNSGSTINLVAPTTGQYAGILAFQAASDTQAFIMDSGSKSVWQGAIYIPGAQLTLNSGGNVAAYTVIEANSVMVNSGAKLDLGSNFSSLPGGSPAKGSTAILVE